MRPRRLRSWETRRFNSLVHATADPTATTVEWAAVDITAADNDPAAWTAGSWGAWDATALTALTTSPTFGTTDSTVSPDVTLTEGTTYNVYVRSRSATDAPGDLVAVLQVD